ncbi:RNA polymerase sigma factor [Dyadobacter sp. CY323]|uniref:RNA polymerase sigma factor n=1 Tax=Dyadobacter sp. CY323 TaxID=2907302 RepID=UPI001F41DC5C|nr:sigma-70 family RNA polymerase sigma factor [Dyadobacter sp. CY323]MCE6989773.1 sigma-70 family RNA polymerase sigma factor [Dyadobacter sp. CY323]
MREISAAEDSLLMLQIREGNRDAFDALYRKHWKFVYNAAYKRLENYDQAKDIAQDVFIQFWTQQTSRVSAPAIDNLSAYLFVAVRNNVLKWMESEKKFVPIPELLVQLESRRDHADAQVRYNELRAAFETVVERLPQQQQVIFRMRYDFDLSSDEIADKLNVSPKTVRNQLGRALLKLKTALLMSLVCISSFSFAA